MGPLVSKQTVYTSNLDSSECPSCTGGFHDLYVNVTHEPRRIVVAFSTACVGVQGYDGPNLGGALQALALIGTLDVWNSRGKRTELDEIVFDLKREFGHAPSSAGSEPTA